MPAPVVPKPERLKVKIASVTPGTGKYGVGMTVTVRFAKDVPKRARALVEQAVTVTSSIPVTAAWSWTGKDAMVLRPEGFWPEFTRVTVHADLDGSPLVPVPGRNEVLRLSGGRDVTLKIGRERTITVYGRRHEAAVTRGDRVVRRMPVSLGKPGWETRSGVKVIMERYRVRRMTSEGVGAPEYYVLDVPYALRITNSGEFLHGAPWAVGRLGRANGSHGCTNLTVEDAKWLFDTALAGDPVITRGTSKPMEPWNGFGGPWNVEWDRWLAGSASGQLELVPEPGLLPPGMLG